jgi:ABC-type multidrug transport system ATPase subunit
MIEIQSVSKRYGNRLVLDDVSLVLRPGEVTLLLGANGAGKSTLLRCLLGLVEHDGMIRVNGLDPLRAGPAVRTLIGYMPQSGGLHPDLTVAETMAFYADVRRVTRDRIAPLLEEAGLACETATRVSDLSGGMRQRLGFAVALLADPPVLVLDEPSSSLDAASRRWLASRLRAMAAEGRTVLVSTHSGQQLFDAGDRHLTIEDGRVTETAPGAAGLTRGLKTGSSGMSGAVAPIIRKELRDALHNRWLMGFAGLLGVLGLAATASAYDSVSGLSLQAFGRTTATLMNLCLLLAPLVAVLMGAAAIAGEQDRGTLEHLLAQPLSRTRLLLAKHTALAIALTGATVAGFLPAGVLIAVASGFGMFGYYLLFPMLAVLAATALAGIGLLISVSSRSAVQAQGTAVIVWFTFALLYDLVLVGVLAMGGMPAEWLATTLVANPLDATRVLGVLALEPDLYLLGPAGALLTTRLTPIGAAALLVTAIACWAIAPVLLAAVKFSAPLRRKQSHEANHSRVALGRGRPDPGNRVRVERAGI